MSDEKGDWGQWLEEQLGPRLATFVQWALAMQPSAPVTSGTNLGTVGKGLSRAEGVARLRRYVGSLGRYSRTAALGSVWGLESPQAFCRLAAVFGSLFILRRQPLLLSFPENSPRFPIEFQDSAGQTLRTQWLISSASWGTPRGWTIPIGSISRAVAVTTSPLREGFVLAVFPPGTVGHPHPIFVLQYGPELSVSPSGACTPRFFLITDLVHFWSVGVQGPLADLSGAVRVLLRTPTEEEGHGSAGKPTMVYQAFFSLPLRSSVASLPPRVAVVPDDLPEVDCEGAIAVAQNLFAQICPNEPFMPKVPNPEDIVWVCLCLWSYQEQEEEGATQS